METVLHLTSGDCAGDSLAESGLLGKVLVWHDILYDGPRRPGIPDDVVLADRARFLEQVTGGGLGREFVLASLKDQYEKLAAISENDRIVLWFDACLFDQSMLAHILACMPEEGLQKTELLCVDFFPGIKPYNGLGQLQPHQLASLYDRRRPVTKEQVDFAKLVDRAFSLQDQELFLKLAKGDDRPLPWIGAAVRRWLLEQPDPVTGLGRLETMALEAIRAGCTKPMEIFDRVADADTPPQFWGDITLWATINSLADLKPPLVRIDGPNATLPQWNGDEKLKEFHISAK